METIDDETTDAAIDFIQRQTRANRPFFCWMNMTRMHVFTHIRPSMQGQSGMPGNDYADGMIEHDGHVGKLLKALDDLGIANNTILVYTTDNGPNRWSWPDAATSPFRNEKDSNWEADRCGGRLVVAAVPASDSVRTPAAASPSCGKAAGAHGSPQSTGPERHHSNQATCNRAVSM